jgi:hypothetical protein
MLAFYDSLGRLCPSDLRGHNPVLPVVLPRVEHAASWGTRHTVITCLHAGPKVSARLNTHS